jgi:DNA polymerase III subunit beta
MHLIIPAADLAAVARTAARAVRPQHGRKFPILACCRITAGGDPLAAYATDLGTAIAATCNADVIKLGECCVDASKLADIAGKLPKGDVTITTTNGLTIRSGRSRFTLTTLAVEDFSPAFEIDDGGPSCELSAADIMALFAGAVGAAASTDQRVYLSGPSLFSEPTDTGHRPAAVGTDTIALSCAATPAACPDLGQGVIIHRDTCRTAVGLFGETGASLRIDKNLVEIRSDSVRLIAKLVDATVPTWRSMVPPAEVSNGVLVKRADLVSALEQCAAVYNNLPHDAGKRAPSPAPVGRRRR